MIYVCSQFGHELLLTNIFYFREGILLSSFYWSYCIGNWVAMFVSRFDPKHLIIVSIALSAATFFAVPFTIGWLPEGGMVLVLRLICGIVEGTTFPAVTQYIQVFTFSIVFVFMLIKLY